MRKIEIDKDRLITTAKKVLPWVIGGGVVIAGGIILYKRGFLKGVSTGMHSGVELTIKEIADHLGESVNHVCIYNNSNGIPVIMKGAAVVSEADIPAAVNLVNANCANVTPEAIATSTEQLTNMLLKKGV